MTAVWIRGIVLFLALGATFPTAACAEGGGELAWRTDFQTGLEEAVLLRKPILVTFYTSWCGWCRKLDHGTFRDPEFLKLGDHLIPIKIDGEADRGLTSMMRVSGFPTTVLLSRRGEELGRIVGYRPPGEFTRAVLAGLGKREAVRTTMEAAETRPDDAAAQYSLGDMLLGLGRHTEAEAAFRRALALPGPDEDFRANAALDLGLSVYLAGRSGDAIALFERYLNDFPAHDRRDQGEYFLGRALLAAGRLEEARARLGRVATGSGLSFLRNDAKRLLAAE